MTRDIEVQRIKKDWSENPRWNGVKRGYTAEDVFRLRGSVQVSRTAWSFLSGYAADRRQRRAS